MIELSDILDLLHGNISIHNAILKQNRFWKIVSKRNPTEDIVIVCSRDDINCDILPSKNSFFKILTKDVADYVKKLEENLKGK